MVDGIKWFLWHMLRGAPVRLVRLFGLIGERTAVIASVAVLLGVTTIPDVWVFLSTHGGGLALVGLYVAGLVQSMFLDYRHQKVRADDADDRLCGGDKKKAAQWPLVQEQLERLAKKLEAMKYELVGKDKWNLGVPLCELDDWITRAFGQEEATRIQQVPQENRGGGDEPDPIPAPMQLGGEEEARWLLDVFARELRRLAEHGTPRQLQRYFKVGQDPF